MLWKVSTLPTLPAESGKDCILLGVPFVLNSDIWTYRCGWSSSIFPLDMKHRKETIWLGMKKKGVCFGLGVWHGAHGGPARGPSRSISLDRKVWSCGLRHGDDTKLMRVRQRRGDRRVSLHPGGLQGWAGLGGPQLPTHHPLRWMSTLAPGLPSLGSVSLTFSHSSLTVAGQHLLPFLTCFQRSFISIPDTLNFASAAGSGCVCHSTTPESFPTESSPSSYPSAAAPDHRQQLFD